MSLTPDFALGYRALMADGFTREVETTKKVLAAIPDGKKDYRPDPNARTAWELAWHLANTDVQFMDGIADLEFKMAARSEAEKPKTVAELVTWYDKNTKRCFGPNSRLVGRAIGNAGQFYGRIQLAGSALSGIS